ncbi:MAG: hypothetical protein ACRBCI_07930 [Cellvibrionaceae bacterium]
MTTKVLTFAAIVLVMLTACANPYYGYSKEGWDSLSINQKIAIKEEYQLMLDNKNNRKNTDKIEERTQSIIDYGSSRQIYTK